MWEQRERTWHLRVTPNFQNWVSVSCGGKQSQSDDLELYIIQVLNIGSPSQIANSVKIQEMMCGTEPPEGHETKALVCFGICRLNVY